MLIKEYFYNIECDCCKTLADDSLWHTDPEGVEEIADQSLWRTLGGKHYGNFEEWKKDVARALFLEGYEQFKVQQ